MSTDSLALTSAAAHGHEDTLVKTDERSHARLGWWIVLAGLGSFFLWASIAPLDRGVSMGGSIIVAGHKKSVQHLSGGTVKSILVQEGERVTAGQPLVQMDSVQSRSSAEITRIQYLTALGTEARLLAERDGRAGIDFPTELRTAGADPGVAASLTAQRQLFASRQASLRSELAAIEQNIGGVHALNIGLEASRSGKLLQLRLLKEQLDGLRELTRDGYSPRNRLLELERQHAQLEASVAEDSASLGRSQSQISELRLRQLQRQQDFQKEVRSQLAELQKEVGGLRNRLEGLDYEVANAVVKSPVDGLVSDLNVFTEGGVVGPGVRMMDIVPMDEPLVIEGQIPIELVDSVHPDLPVELILSAFNQNTTPRVPARVTQVSPDRLVDPTTGMPFYRLRAEVTPEGRRMLIRLQVRPGMPVELFVKTGERSLMAYLLRPLQDNLKNSLTEE